MYTVVTTQFQVYVAVYLLSWSKFKLNCLTFEENGIFMRGVVFTQLIFNRNTFLTKKTH